MEEEHVTWKSCDRSVVATTCWNSTCDMLTSAKLFSRLSSSEDYKRTQQGALTTLLSYLYKLQVVYATTMCLPHIYSAVTVQDCASCPNDHMSYMW